MPEPVGFELRATIQAELDVASEPDNRVIAHNVMAQIPEELYPAIILHLLVYEIRRLSSPWNARRAAMDFVGRQPHPARRPSPALLRKILRSTVEVRPGVRRFLGECGAEDLTMAAENYRTIADNVLQQALRFERLSVEVSRRGAKKVDELPGQLIIEVMGSDPLPADLASSPPTGTISATEPILDPSRSEEPLEDQP